MRVLYRYPKACSGAISTVTLLCGAMTIVLADFGAPRWVFAALLLVPATVGLPSTLAVLGVASIWGRGAGAFGLLAFVVVASVTALTAQLLAGHALARWRRQREERV